MNDAASRAGVVTSTGARTPEELELLLEDTLLLGDPQALAALFVVGAVFDCGAGQRAHGGEAIAGLALATWTGEHGYLADPQCVIQARDLALIVGARATNVARRGSDGTWRYAIVHQHDEY